MKNRECKNEMREKKETEQVWENGCEESRRKIQNDE